MAIKGAIFDMDGTLLDSMHVWIGIASRYMKMKGLELTPEIENDINGMMLKEISEYFIKNFGLPLGVDEIIDEINKLVEDDYFNKVQLKPGVLELLESLKQQGVKMCVATATDRYMAEAALKRCKIYNYFEFMYTCTEVGANKTLSKIYDVALDRLGTDKADTYVFEDTYIPVRTAKDACYPLVAVADEWSARNAEKIKTIADVYVDDFSKFDISSL